MKTKFEKNGQALTVYVEGQLNVETSATLQKEIFDRMSGIAKVIFEFENLDYISSSGLRVLALVIDRLGAGDMVVIRHPNQFVLEVLSMTGFDSILTVER